MSRRRPHVAELEAPDAEVFDDAAREDEPRETVDTPEPAIPIFPDPPIFAASGEPLESKRPLTHPIVKIVVRKAQDVAGGALSSVGWHPVEDLEDEQSVLKQYGPGKYEIVGQNQYGQIVRKRTFSVGDLTREYQARHGIAVQEPPKPPVRLDGALAAIAAVAAPIVTLITAMLDNSAKRHDALMAQLASAQSSSREEVSKAQAIAAEANAKMMHTMTTMFAARVADVENAATPKGGGGGISKDDMTELIALGLELGQQSKAEEGGLERAITAAVEGWTKAHGDRIAGVNGVSE